MALTLRQVCGRFSGLWQRSCLLNVRTGPQLTCRCFGQAAPQTHPHLVSEGEVTPGVTVGEYRDRRIRLFNEIRENKSTSNKKHIAIIPAAAKLYMSHDIPYMFRQNTDFLYLCGFMEPNSVLVLQSDGSDHISTLFVPKRDLSKELWEGPRSGVDGAITLTGVDRADNIDCLAHYLTHYAKDNNGYVVWYDFNKPSNIELHIRYIGEFLKNRVLSSPRRLIQKLRSVKSEAELRLMKESCRISSQAFKQVMNFSHPNVNESHLHARMEYECRIRSAEYLAYPPVVAGGNRANTIHYIQNNQLVEDGDLVLMDAGCEYHGYASDITRTWPVSGTFTNVQREAYEALLEVNEECIKLANPDNSIESIFSQMLTLLGRQLQRLGILPQSASIGELQNMSRTFCPHHVGHYLGMDVHDTDEVSRIDKLQPGMVVTIEPGLYIPHTKTGVPRELRGMGMRVEDDILVTEDLPVNMTQDCPKHVDLVESTITAHHSDLSREFNS